VRLLGDRHRVGNPLLQILDPRGGRRVRGEELGRPCALRCSFHVLPQRHTLARVESRSRHPIEADQVGLALVGAAELQRDALGTDAERRHRESVRRTRRIA
jgi:hypothetical protein